MEKKKLEELKQRLREEFSDYYEFAGGKNYRYHHLVTVHNYVRKLMEELEVDADREVVEVAALFHDIGRSKDIEDGYLDPIEKHEGHAERGAEIVAGFIEDVLSQEKVEKVKQVVKNHHSEPETVEGKIVQDADLLFKYGVHNIWRKVHYSAEQQEEIHEALEYVWNSYFDRNQDKLDDFHFDYTRKKAEERMQHFKQVIETIESQLDGEDL